MISQLRIIPILTVCLGAIAAVWLASGSQEKNVELPTENHQQVDSQQIAEQHEDQALLDESSDAVYLPYVQVFFDPEVKSLLTAQVSAPIVAIRKRMGDSFAANETLIQLYDDVYLASIGKAKGLLEKSQVGLTAKQQLFNDGVASLFDVADYQANVAAALSDLATANYAYHCCSLQVPYAGYVASVLVNDYETPQVGQPMIEVVDTRTLIAKMIFDSAYIDQLFVGQKVNIAVREIGGDVEGTILRIAPVIDPASAKFKVEAEVSNPEGKIKPGMSGKIALKTLGTSPSQIPSGGSVR